MDRFIVLADAESFYCSVEKSAHPEYRDSPLVVAGDPARRSGIILAACPIAKSFGVKTAERLGEAIAKCPNLVIIQPRMQLYIDVSMQITRIYQSYSDLVEPFSIDEQFIDVTGSLHLFGKPEAMASLIQKRVWEETGVRVRLGAGKNKVTAKTACDNFAKKNPSGYFLLDDSNIADTLWQLPIDKMYMVGSRMTRHFNSLGLYTIGQLAATPLDKLKLLMRRKFGKNSDINAEMYWRIANCIDDSPVQPGTHEVAPKSIGHMMTLPRDYGTWNELKTIVLELTELVCQRARSKGLMGSVISLGCMGADYDLPTGFSRQMTLADPSNITNQIYAAALELLKRHWDQRPVRRVGISITKLVTDDQYQVSLFEQDREKLMALERATDAIKRKYGDSIIMRAVSATDAGQAKDRAGKIGGHFK